MVRNIIVPLVGLFVASTPTSLAFTTTCRRLPDTVPPTPPVHQLSAKKRGLAAAAELSKQQQQQQQQPKNAFAQNSNRNWLPTPVSTSALPTTENTVALIKTELFTLKDGQTNPSGAVAVTKYNNKLYCFDVQCPTCRIPLTKATCTTTEEDPGPSLVCDFCKSTYQLDNGGVRSSESAAKPGILGSIAMNVFSAQTDGRPLKMYELGEKKGKVVISLD